jgi:hypothetical protein
MKSIERQKLQRRWEDFPVGWVEPVKEKGKFISLTMA